MSHSFKESDTWKALISIFRIGKKEESFSPILWAGAGLSVSSGYPTTLDLIKLIREKSLLDLPDFTPWDSTLATNSPKFSFTHWVQEFAFKNGYGRLNATLASIFTNLPKDASSMHVDLVNLPWNKIYTTNYDQLLENALDKNNCRYNLVTLEQNIGLEQSNLLSLYKIHGGYHNISNWIFDEDSYLKFSDQYPFLIGKLHNDLLSRSIVYFGCSMLDPRVIEWYKLCESQNKLNKLQYSITVMREQDWRDLPADLKELYKKAQVNPLLYKDFNELPDLISSLVNEITRSEKELLEERVINDEKISTVSEVERLERENQEIEDLLYESLAPQIVKAIANIWLCSDVGLSYTEELQRIVGTRGKIKGRNAFERLLDDVVELALGLLGIKAEHSTKIHLINELATILQNNPIYHNQLDKINFEPHALYGSLKVQYLEVSSPSFDQILKELCEVIIDCSNALPTWNESNLITQLEDDSELFKKLREELASWKQTKEQEKDESSLIESEYRRAIVRRFDELRIFGVNFGKRARKYQLTVAYISLTTETEFNEFDDTCIMSTEDALTNFEHLVILGEAGQGKTTLLQWLTVQCGRKAFQDEEWNKKVPVLIQLRKVLNDAELPEQPDFYDLMVENVESELSHQEWASQVIEEKRAIFMIDGFDEVPKTRRSEVVLWIESLCERYKGNRFVLTSRPSAYEDTTLDKSKFQVIELQPMDRKAQNDFVAHWHNAIALEYDQTKPDALLVESDELKQKLSLQNSLRHLAQTPLLCGVICMLHHDRSGYLPRDRSDLYESTSRMFLDNRDRERKIIEENNFNLLDYRYKQTFLCDIAQNMTKKEKTSISPSALRLILEQKLLDIPDLKWKLSAEDLLRFFLERSGLLQKVGNAEIQFAHRSFQEFFTAEYIVSNKDWELLKKNATNDYWHETIQLAVGLSKSKDDNENFLTSILELANKFESDKKNVEAIPLYLIVLRCKESMREITPAFSMRLEKIIPKVIPPPNAKVKDAIGDSGNLALPYLKRPKKARVVKHDLYCAQALIKIETSESYLLLLDYLKDNRSSYVEKLANSLKKLAPELALEINLEHLLISEGVDSYPKEILEVLAFICQSQKLYYKSQYVDLVTIENWQVALGLEPINGIDFNTVKTVLAYNDDLNDLEFLPNCKNLKKIICRGKHTTHLNIISTLNNLTALDIYDTCVNNLSAVSGLRKLKHIDFSSTYIEDISPLCNLVELKTIKFNATSVTNLDVFINLVNVERVEFYSTFVNDLSPLSCCTKITFLDCSHTDISDISPISYMLNIVKLELDYTGVSDISALSNCNELEYLSLCSSDIEELSAVSNCTNLKYLNCSNLNVVDLEMVPKNRTRS
ncbi:NACHT domain-containing protein [Psychromonas aquimarina]|uniref:NACHT domain-containing protein n=1 Tax=Psychromonas aquimarina TaxID=444919 RepID=UPI000426527F|nr:NACHT domain-containing protein [Psychromonas aquimarina]